MQSIKQNCNLEKVYGYTSCILSGLMKVFGAACVQRLGRLVPPFQLNCARYSAQLLFSLIYLLYACTSSSVPLKDFPWLLAAAVVSILYNTLVFEAAEMVPIGNLMVMHMTVMYITSAILSRIFLKKPLYLILCIIFLFVVFGQLLLTQPCSIFHTDKCSRKNFKDSANNTDLMRNSTEKESNNETPENLEVYFGYILTISAGVVGSFNTLIVNTKVGHINTSVVSFWLGLIGLISSSVIMFYTEEPTTSLSIQNTFLLIGHAGFTAGSSTSAVHANQRLDPVVYVIISNLTAVFGFIFQYALPMLFLPGNRNLLEIIGAVIVVTAILTYVVITSRIERNTSLDAQ